MDQKGEKGGKTIKCHEIKWETLKPPLPVKERGRLGLFALLGWMSVLCQGSSKATRMSSLCLRRVLS